MKTLDPQTLSAIAKQVYQMPKQAGISGAAIRSAIPYVPYVLAGAGGAALGQKGLPEFLGYKEDQYAKNISSLQNMSELPALLYVLRHAPKKYKGYAMAGLGLTELIPRGFAEQSAATAASRAQTAAALADIKEKAEQTAVMKELAKKPSTVQEVRSMIPANAKSTLIGLGVGGAGAGLAGLISGSVRRKTPQEEEQELTRGQMVRNDMLKYLLPGLILGGVGGSLAGPRASTAKG